MPPNKKYILSTFTVPGYHYWPGAPGEYAYLSHPHRHLFYIRAVLSVANDNRQVEFIDFGKRMRNWLLETFAGLEGECEFGSLSCEMIAEKLLRNFALTVCSVLEDNENGAIISAGGQDDMVRSD